LPYAELSRRAAVTTAQERGNVGVPVKTADLRRKTAKLDAMISDLLLLANGAEVP